MIPLAPLLQRNQIDTGYDSIAPVHSMTSIEDQRRLLLERMKATGEGRPPLERRRRRRASLPPPKKRWSLPPKVKQYLPYVVAFLVILAPLLHNPPRNNNVPPYLIGAWKSDTPGYEDRYMMFTQHSVVFGTGGYSGEVYVVDEVQTSPAAEGAPGGSSKRELFTIRYMKVDRLKFELSFYYDPPPLGIIAFKNQEELKWTRKGTES